MAPRGIRSHPRPEAPHRLTIGTTVLAAIDALNQGETINPDEMNFLSFGTEIPAA
jgi:hypothetical protein